MDARDEGGGRLTEFRVACSPITKVIYAGNTRIDRNGNEVWTSNRRVVTEMAVDAVVERLKSMPGKMEEYKWQIDGKFYVLKLVELEDGKK